MLERLSIVSIIAFALLTGTLHAQVTDGRVIDDSVSNAYVANDAEFEQALISYAGNNCDEDMTSIGLSLLVADAEACACYGTGCSQSGSATARVGLGKVFDINKFGYVMQNSEPNSFVGVTLTLGDGDAFGIVDNDFRGNKHGSRTVTADMHWDGPWWTPPQGDLHATVTVKVDSTWTPVKCATPIRPGGSTKATGVLTFGSIPSDESPIWEVDDPSGHVKIAASWGSGNTAQATVTADKDACEGKYKVTVKHPLDSENSQSAGFVEVKCGKPKEECEGKGSGTPPGVGDGGCCGGGGGPGSPGGTPSGIGVGPGAPDVEFGMGNQADGSSAGTIAYLQTYDPPTTSFRSSDTVLRRNRSSLIYSNGRDNVEALYDKGGLRQILTDSVFADLVDCCSDGDCVEDADCDCCQTGGDGCPSGLDVYSIRYYDIGDAVAPSGDETLYTVATGSEPYAKIVVQNSAEDCDELHIDRYMDNGSGLEKVSGYSYIKTDVTSGFAWTLTHKDGEDATVLVEVESWVENTSTSGEWTRTYEASDGTTVAKTVTEEWTDPFENTARLHSRSINGDTTEYYRSEDNNTSLTIFPDYSWKAVYKTTDTGGVPIRYESEGWLNALFPGTDPATHLAQVQLLDETTSNIRLRKTQYYVDPYPIPHNYLLSNYPEVVEEYVNGQLLSRTTYEYSLIHTTTDNNGNKRFKLTTYEYQDVDRDDTDHLYTKTIEYIGYNERLARVNNPDGSYTNYAEPIKADFTFSTSNPTWETNTYSGAYTVEQIYQGPQSSYYLNGISTRSTLVRDADGRLVLEEESIWYGSWERISWTVYRYDETEDPMGRETHAYHSNGTYRHTVYAQDACCGSKTVTDENGIVTQYVYNTLGQLMSVTRPGPNGGTVTTSTDYDYNGSLGGVSGSLLVTKTVTPSTGGSLANASLYDSQDRLLVSQDSAGLLTYYTYTEPGTSSDYRTVTVTKPGGDQIITSYYHDGRVKSITGDVVPSTYEYDVVTTTTPTTLSQTVYQGPVEQGRYTTQYTNGLGQTIKTEKPGYGGTITTTNTYDQNTGRLDQTDTTGQPTTYYNYNDSTGTTTIGQSLDGNTTLSAYGTDRFTITQTKKVYLEDSQTQTSDWWDQTTTTRYRVDGNGYASVVQTNRSRLTGFDTTDYDAEHVTAESASVTTYTDESGQVVEETTTSSQTALTRAQAKVVTTRLANDFATTPDISTAVNGFTTTSSTSSGIDYTYGYDDFGRQITMTDGRSNTNTTHYNSMGQVDWVENAHGDRTSYTYSPTTGQTITVSNHENSGTVDTHYGYDLQGRLTKTWGDVPLPTWTEYDDFGQRKYLHTYRTDNPSGEGEWPAGDVTTWNYDPATGLLTSKLDEHQKEVSYTYTLDGKLDTRTWARGLATKYYYDSDTGMLAKIDYGNDDGDNPELEFTYTRYGHLASVIDNRPNAPTYSYSYEDWPSKTKETINWDGGQTTELTREFDAAGRLVELSDGAGYAVNYEYDAATGRMNRVDGPGLPAGGASYTYLANTNLRDCLFFQDGSSNSVALSRNYYETTRDLISSVANYTYPASAQTEISEYAYVNDALGRRTQVTYTGDAFDTGSGTVQTFKYNSRNELRYASASPSAAKRSFNYDNIGNRTFMDIGSGDQTTDYSTNELNQYFLVTKEQDDLGAVSRHCSNMRYDLDGNLTEMWHVDATNTFRGGFVGDMTGPTADRTSEVASASMKRIVPMKMASEETGYESEELLFTEGSLAISLTPLGGGQVGTTLQPHTTYWMTYTTDTSATDFVVVASAESAAQGLQAALAPYSGDWSDNTNFAYVDLESLFGSLDDSGDTRLVKTDIITNHLTSPAGTSGRLCRFTTGDAGELRLHVELIASDSQTNQIDLRTITLNLEVVDSVVQGNHDAHENVVLAASGSSSMIGNRDSSSAEIGWSVEGDAAPQLLAWYTQDNGQGDCSTLASLTSNTPSSISEDVFSTEASIFAAPDFSLAMLASILGQSSTTNYDFNNDGDVDIRDYAALMLMGQSQEDQSLLLTWDAENRLIAVEPQSPVEDDTKITFAYDYKGRRVYKFVYTHDGTDWETTETSRTRYVYDGWRVIEESTVWPQASEGPSNTERQYVWGLDLSGSLEGAGGIGGLLSVNDVTTSTTGGVTDDDYIYFYDANGNVVQVVKVTDNSAPALAAHYEYSPYGQRVNNADSEEYDQPFRFSTKMFDTKFSEEETGFGYWGERYYSPELGRWLNRDPIEDKGGMNLMMYVHNDPVVKIDSIGLMYWSSGEYYCGPGVVALVGSWCALKDVFDAAASGFWGTAEKQFDCVVDCEIKANLCLCAIAGGNAIPIPKDPTFEFLRLIRHPMPGENPNTQPGRIIAELIRQHLGKLPKCSNATDKIASIMHKVMSQLKRVRINGMKIKGGGSLTTAIAVVETGIAVSCSIKCMYDYYN